MIGQPLLESDTPSQLIRDLDALDCGGFIGLMVGVSYGSVGLLLYKRDFHHSARLDFDEFAAAIDGARDSILRPGAYCASGLSARNRDQSADRATVSRAQEAYNRVCDLVNANPRFVEKVGELEKLS